MKHRSVQILLCLILGVLTTNSAAWVGAVAFQREVGALFKWRTLGRPTRFAPQIDTRYMRQRSVQRVANCKVTHHVAGPSEKLWSAFGHYLYFGEAELAEPFADEILATTSPVDFVIVLSKNENRAKKMLERTHRVLGHDIANALDEHLRRGLAAIGKSEIPTTVDAAATRDLALQYSNTDLKAGWPLAAFRAHVLVVMNGPSPVYYQEGVIELPDVFADRLGATMIPVTPIPLGIAIDAIVFATLWGVVWGGARLIRDSLRLRHGRCPRCGYILTQRSGHGCSECGWNRPVEEVDSQRETEGQ